MKIEHGLKSSRLEDGLSALLAERFLWFNDENSFPIPSGMAHHDMQIVQDNFEVYALQDFHMVLATPLISFDDTVTDAAELSRQLAFLILTYKEYDREIDFVEIEVDGEESEQVSPNIQSILDSVPSRRLVGDERSPHVTGVLSDRPSSSLVSRVSSAIRAFKSPSPTQSEWVQAIGPVYSLQGFSAALALDETMIDQLATSNQILSLRSQDGIDVFPASQLKGDRVLRGVPWILSTLDEAIIDRHSLAIWLHQDRKELDGCSIWMHLQFHGNIDDDIKFLVNRLKNSLLAN